MSERTVQAWIEAPPDGAGAGGDGGWPSLAPMQWLLWSLATAGKLFEGLIVFMGGLALPLVAARFGLDAAGQGLLSAATLAGILLGALVLGGVADRVGRRPVFIGEMLILALALLAAGLSPTAGALMAGLFVVGLALGADYPTAHLVISESIPAVIRGRLVLGAFSFQALGALLGTLLASQLLAVRPELSSWRLFYLLPVIPVLLVAIGRLFLPESSHWLISRGRRRQAEQQLKRLLGRTDVELADPEPAAHQDGARTTASWRQLFRGKLQRATILASVPWFLQDLSTYGIGIFTPVILAAGLGGGSSPPGSAADRAGALAGLAASAATEAPASAAAAVSGALAAGGEATGPAALASAVGDVASAGQGLAQLIQADLLAARGAALADVGLLVGIACAIVLTDRWGRIRLQIIGFLGCALALVIAAIGSSGPRGHLGLVLLGFVLFQFMTNLGPNAQTYLLAGEVFPTPLRGLGAGLAAAAGKVGAVLTAFLFPVLLRAWGSDRLLPLLVLTSLLGALVTWLYRIETRGLTPESS